VSGGGRVDFRGLLVLLKDFRRSSLVAVDCSFTISTCLCVGDDASDPVIKAWDEYPESLLDFLSLPERLSRSLLLFFFVLAVRLVPRTIISLSSHSST
jgi:hypothetical protein